LPPGQPVDPADFPRSTLELFATDLAGNRLELVLDLSPGKAGKNRVRTRTSFENTADENESGAGLTRLWFVLGILLILSSVGVFVVNRKKS
jgi:hypothetical protein